MRELTAGRFPMYNILMDTFFAAAAPGLERLTTQELTGLGLAAPRAEPGGVTFAGSLLDLYRANLHLRTASRLLARLGEFYAAAFSELRKKAGRLSWERFLAPGQPVALHVTCHKSRLYHSGAVAERVAGAIADRLGQPSPVLPPAGDGEGGAPPQLIVVRLSNDLCTISVDASGELLHRRGYRLAAAKAPLRETLAAAILLASGWDAASPLLDPFCGSGTVAIEAALLAMRRPPGMDRRFAFMDWPGYDPARWQALLDQARRPSSEGSRPLPPIQASDRDDGAVAMAEANASRAGADGAIEFTRRALSAIDPPPGPGWVVTNPPYGLRTGSAKDLRNLYAQLGHVLRRACPGWRVAVLCSDLSLLSQTGLKLEASFATVSGGVNVRLGRGKVD